MNLTRIKNMLLSEKASVLADQAVVSGSAFLTNILVAKALGLSAYGIFAGLVLGQYLILSVQHASISGLYQVIFPRLNTSWKQAYDKGILPLFFVFIAVVISLGIPFYLLFASLSRQVELPLEAILVSTLFFLFQDLLRKIFLTRGSVVKALWIDLLTNGLQVCTLVYLWITGNLTLTAAVWTTGLTFIPSVALGLWWFRPGMPSWKQFVFTYRQHLRQSGWLVLSALLQYASSNFFVLASGWWLGAAALGVLRLVQYIFGTLNVAFQAIENLALPKASSASLSKPALTGYLRNIFYKSMLGVLPVLVLLSIFAKPLLTLIGGEDAGSYALVMPGMALVYLLILAGYPVRIAIRSQLLNKAFFTGYLLVSVFSVATAPWIIRSFDLYGVLAGLFFGQLIMITYWFIILHKKEIFLWKSYISY